MSKTYNIILSGFIILSIIFALSPWFTLYNISQAAHSNDKKQWQALVKTKTLQIYAGKLLEGLADMKMYAEMKQNPAQAMQDNLLAKQQIPLIAAKFSDSQGIKHLLCGEITNSPYTKIKNTTECWGLHGSLSWQSLTRTKITFNNPEKNWQSSLILERIGLFQWQAIDVELPIETIIERFAKSMGLEKQGI